VPVKCIIAKIIALETRLAPRELTKEQIATISAKIGAFKEQRWYFASASRIKERTDLAAEIKSALAKASWRFDTNQGWGVGGDEEGVVYFRGPETGPTSAKNAATALASGLNDEGIAAEARELTPLGHLSSI
jgi:hypothetical protein